MSGFTGGFTSSITVNLAGIAPFLTQHPRWLGWKTEIRNDKPTKVPKSWKNFNAKSTDPKTWAPFSDIAGIVQKQPALWDGIGITFGDIGSDEYLGGLDLNSCLNAQGELADWARPVAEAARTYLEVSPSAGGLKAFFRFSADDMDVVRKAFGIEQDKWGCRRGVGGNGKDHGPAVEVYLSGRFFAVTGKHWPASPQDVALLDRAALLHIATLVQQAIGAGTSKPGSGKDDSRSATAFRLGAKLCREGKTYDEMCAGLREHPETAAWYKEKGEAAGGRELRRIWEKASSALILSASSPLDSARELIRRNYTQDEQPTLHHQQATFYRHTGTCYAELPREGMSAAVYHFLDAAHTETKDGDLASFKPNQRAVGWVLDALAAASQLPPDIKSPAWLDDKQHAPASEIVAFTNGLLHLPSRRLRPHTPLFFNMNAVDYAYDAKAPEARQWLDFLASIWPQDQQSIDTMQEIFGLVLTADTSHQKAFLIVGPKRSGKGTIARVLTAMLGKQNVAGPTLSSLGDRFGLQPLIDKPLAVISDARLSGRTDAAVVAERILSISGEDAITVDRKNRDAWTGALPTRFLILTNELPRLSDASGALVSRFIVLCLINSFYGREDMALTNKLLAERSGILNWALDGYDRLRKRGYFIQPATAQEAVRQMEDLGSPISAFVRDRCTLKVGASIEVDHLFSAWVEWCRDQNVDRPGNKGMFGKELRAAFPGLRRSQPRAEDGARLPSYEGIQLKK